jgi:putative DNA primase/helicase
MNAPERIAVHYLARSGEWRLPVLAGTITAPTLRPDGTVLQEPGYDAATRLWYDPGKTKFPKVPKAPSRERPRRSSCCAAFKTFPFAAAEVDESVALAALLTGLMRRTLPTAPCSRSMRRCPGPARPIS